MTLDSVTGDSKIVGGSLRVKVYVMFAEQWREKGIGHLSICRIDNDRRAFRVYHQLYASLDNGTTEENDRALERRPRLPLFKMTVRSQDDPADKLVSTFINTELDYVVQDGSILSWKDSDTERALSFESAEECSGVMDVINEARNCLLEMCQELLELPDDDQEGDNNIDDSSGRLIDDDDDDNDDDDNLKKDTSNRQWSQVELNDEEGDGDDPSALSLALTLPEVNSETLDDWIQVTSAPMTTLNSIVNSFGNSGAVSGIAANMILRDGVLGSFTEERNQQIHQQLADGQCLDKFIKLFHENEDENNLDLVVLFKLYQILRNLISAESYDLYRLLFEDSSKIMDVIGILEYDPTLDERVEHRDFLKNKAKFRKFFMIEESITRENITETSAKEADDSQQSSALSKQEVIDQICKKATFIYRVQYIIDHVLPTPSIFDEKINHITSYLNYHRAELCNLIYDNTVLLRHMFVFLSESIEKKSESVTTNDYIDAITFLHEFCLLSNSLNPSDKDFFFTWLESYSLLKVLCILLKEGDPKVCSKVMDIVALLVDYKISSVRLFISKQLEESVEPNTRLDPTRNVCLMDDLVNTIVRFRSEAVSLQSVSIVNLLVSVEPYSGQTLDSETFEKIITFFECFFYHCFPKLIYSVTQLVTDGVYTPDKDTLDNANLVDTLLALICGWCTAHSENLISAIIVTDIIEKIVAFFESSHSFLVCAVVRFVKRMVAFKDQSVDKLLLQHGVIEKTVELFKEKCLNKNNLLNSTIVELINYLLTENISKLYTPIVEKYETMFLSIDYIDIFRRLVARRDAELNKSTGGVSLSLNSPNNTTISEVYLNARKRRSYDMESSEDIWITSDDDNDDNENGGSGPNDTDSTPSHKKLKKSPSSDDNLDSISSTAEDEDDSALFDKLIGNVVKNKPMNDEEVDDFLENISRCTKKKSLGSRKNITLIKIQTNLPNSSKHNLVTTSPDAETNTSTISEDEPLDDDPLVVEKEPILPKKEESSSPATSHSNKNASKDSLHDAAVEDTLDCSAITKSNYIIETTFEPDSEEEAFLPVIPHKNTEESSDSIEN